MSDLEPLLDQIKRVEQVSESIWESFIKFVNRGNVIHLAVGLVIGSSFQSIVESLVNDIFTPTFGFLLLTNQLSEKFLVLRTGSDPGPYNTRSIAKNAGAITLNWGVFMQILINFLILSISFFLIFQLIRKKENNCIQKTTQHKTCVYCYKSDIDIRAKKCPYCCTDIGCGASGGRGAKGAVGAEGTNVLEVDDELF